MIRGGSWNNDAQSCRSAYRNNNEPDNRNNNLGFRLSSSRKRLDVMRLRIRRPRHSLTNAPDLFRHKPDK
ncbi:sulphatase-modifying factor protein [Candidatus Scalindua japonica]|uniref:Sulphatase-modifying factor protein n=1 Tax=Candidatus Scalindua japonica TaxID=1284222 RepID=A0A286TYF1_9BACT|nr:sulphatase-modifying factor protein [Candidatus Scalindua japonica]